MDKIWLKNYPQAYPTTYSPSSTARPRTCWKRRCERMANPFRCAWSAGCPYRELDRLSAALGAWLQGRGWSQARVAIMLPNIPQFAVTMAAVLRGLHLRERQPALHRTRAGAPAQDSGSTAIVILENFAPRCRGD